MHDDNFVKENVAALIDYFDEGFKKRGQQKIGLELEHFVVRKESFEPVSYDEPGGVHDILMEMSGDFPELIFEEGMVHSCGKIPPEKRAGLIGLACPDYTITLEPAAQLEISIAPRKEISEIQKIYESFTAEINPYLEKRGLMLCELGYRPRGKADELPLIPKKRYAFMDEYFTGEGKHGISASGTMGRNMMRGTASTQVSVDYFDERDFIEKYRLAYILSPVLKFLSSNTPVFEDAPAPQRMMRTAIWRNTDPARCGYLPNVFEEDFGFEKYAEYILRMPLILVIDENHSASWVGKKSAVELHNEGYPLFSGKLPNRQIEHLLSMTFLDVRLKKYIEIRGADSLPKERALAIATLIKGIIDAPGAAEEILARHPVSVKDIIAAEDSLIKNGPAAEIYGFRAEEFFGYLFSAANLSTECGIIETLCRN